MGDSELLSVAKFADLGTLLYFQSRMFSGDQADYKSPWITKYKIFFNWIQTTSQRQKITKLQKSEIKLGEEYKESSVIDIQIWFVTFPFN